MNTESIRKEFLPDQVKLLLVGESPPTCGGFFYVKSNMTAFTARAFEIAHNRPVTGDDQQAFLEYFKRCGCYLDDICHVPIDGFDPEVREHLLAKSVVGFAERLLDLRPAAVAVVLKKIETHTRIALAIAKLDLPVYVLPFPGHGHQNKYSEELSKIVQRHVTSL